MNIYYIYHSCFAVEGKNHILIFDYYRIPKEKTEEKEYFLINISDKKRKKYMFSLLIAMPIILIRKSSLGRKKILKYDIF